MDLMTALADAKTAIDERDREIADLKSKADRLRSTVIYRGYRFEVDSSGGSTGRPFCPVCEQKDGLFVQIARGIGKHDLCPHCQAIFSDYPLQLPEKHSR